ncbi:TorF family putative porin [Sphingosinicella sp. LHD-64]|uniref:TorF family putative porin n=1 Tax=Sphingosinicella sp. LHD-64 TaxID=3072139 RepID=UPI00280E0E94|nr:TorF family putative porin [Sphingosinicella sp. LHD-64]MDQ8755691.1 TorF family putative porin [Sphingosinicella sp. LHD-64]
MFRTIAALTLLCIAVPAIAQEPASVDLSAEAVFLTDYRFRGVSRSDEDPAGQAALTLSHGSGVYAGLRATTLKGTESFRARDPGFGDLGDAEFDLYAGWRTNLGGGFDLDAGLTYYVFAGGEGATDYVEPYASLGYLIGPVTLSAGARYAPAQRATGDEDMLYLFGQVEVAVPFRPWSFTAQAGHQDWGAYGSYWIWSLGADYHVQIEGIPATYLGLRYIDTDLAAPGADAGLAASLTVRF